MTQTRLMAEKCLMAGGRPVAGRCLMAEGRLTAVKWLAAESRVMTRNALWPKGGS